MTQADDNTNDDEDDNDDYLYSVDPELLIFLISRQRGRLEAKPLWNALRDPRVTDATWRDGEPIVRLIQRRADAGEFTRDERHYMIGNVVERLVETRARETPRFVKGEERRAEIRAAHGVACDDDWDLSQTPREYQRLTEQWGASMMKTAAVWLQELGEREMARLMRVDPEEYGNHQEAGWSTMFGIRISKDTGWEVSSAAKAAQRDRNIQ